MTKLIALMFAILLIACGDATGPSDPPITPPVDTTVTHPQTLPHPVDTTYSLTLKDARVTPSAMSLDVIPINGRFEPGDTVPLTVVFSATEKMSDGTSKTIVSDAMLRTIVSLCVDAALPPACETVLTQDDGTIPYKWGVPDTKGSHTLTAYYRNSEGTLVKGDNSQLTTSVDSVVTVVMTSPDTMTMYWEPKLRQREVYTNCSATATYYNDPANSDWHVDTTFVDPTCETFSPFVAPQFPKWIDCDAPLTETNAGWPGKCGGPSAVTPTVFTATEVTDTVRYIPPSHVNATFTRTTKVNDVVTGVETWTSQYGTSTTASDTPDDKTIIVPVDYGYSITVYITKRP